MRPVSDALLRTIRGSHTAAFRARVVAGHQTGVDPDGTEIKILDGDVQLDATADVRSTLDLTTDGTGMWPTSASSLLAPFGNQVFAERGVEVAGGVREWVSQGYFRIQGPEQDDAPDGPIRLTCQDRMAGVVEARLLAPRPFTATALLGDVVEELVLEVYPAAVIEWDDASDAEQLGRALVAEEDRYTFLRDLVTAAGKVMYFDYRGVLVIKSLPDPGTPVFDVNYGEGGVLIELSRQLSREGVYNAVVATGEAADTQAPVRAVAFDNNPLSPTYFSGAFGPVPRFYSSPFITTQAQAQSAAESILRQQLGLPYSVDFTAVPNPALEPGDPIQVRYSDKHAAETHIVERLTIPLVADQALSGTTREQTLVVIGEA